MEEFKKYAKKEGVIVTDEMIASLNIYLKELLEWNEKFNLTGITEVEDIWHKHFLDSLTVSKHIPDNALKVIDVGTGAGFPGLVVKILNPRLHMTLLEATNKKVIFLNHIIKLLDLKNTVAIQDRAETLGQNKEYRRNFDIVFSRAVALLPTLLEYTLPFLKLGGLFIAQKKAGNEEIESSENALRVLGGMVKEVVKIESEIIPDRQLLIIKQIIPTPDEYPRAEGFAKKRPL